MQSKAPTLAFKQKRACHLIPPLFDAVPRGITWTERQAQMKHKYV